MNIPAESARHWLPRLAAAGISVPDTVIMPYDHRAVVAMMEGADDDRAWGDLLVRCRDAAPTVGWPVFVRTDLASAKHDGPASYRADGPEDLPRVLSFTVEDSEVKFWPGGPTPSAILLRRWLDLDAPFRAFGGHPIAREWRLFASPDGVACSHFYWPADAILDPDRPHWEFLLAGLAADTPTVDLRGLAVRAAAACPEVPAWSIDFAADVHGTWHLIDMAPADLSWHPEHG